MSINNLILPTDEQFPRKRFLVENKIEEPQQSDEHFGNKNKEEFRKFLEESPTPYHFVKNAKELLLRSGFVELKETESWKEIPTKFFVIRESSSIVAINQNGFSKGILIGAHCDSPCLRLHPVQNPNDVTVSVTPYGSPLTFTWFDRELKLAGKVIFKKDGKLYSKLINTSQPIAFLPNQAIHLSSEPSNTLSLSLSYIKPVVNFSHNHSIISIIAKETGCNTEDIENDLIFYSADPPQFTGESEDLLISQRLDDQTNAISSIRAISRSKTPKEGFNAVVIFNNEETGSKSYSGARSTFISDVFSRVTPDNSAIQHLHSCLFLSTDNLHALHPNWSSLKEPNHPLPFGSGVGLSYHRNNFFPTEGISATEIIEIMKKCNVKFSKVIAKNNQSTGGTIGRFIVSKLGMRGIDVGIPVLGMHSFKETAYFGDILMMEKLFDGCFKYGPQFN